MTRRNAVRLLLALGIVALVLSVLRRGRRPEPAAGWTAPPVAARPPEVAEAGLADEREIVDRPAPAASAISHDPEVPEADALAQAQDIDGETLPHDVVGDDRPLADALDQAAVVDDEDA